MALEFATGTLNLGTGAINTNYSVTGKSGTWKALILFWSGRPETADAAGETDMQPGIGFAVSSSSRVAFTGQCDHTAAPTATDRYQTDAACVAILDIAGAVVGLADFVSFNADGFTLIVDDVFPAALEVGYVLLGGTDLTNVATGTFQHPGSTGSFDITTVGFQPDCAFFTTTISGAIPAGGAGMSLAIGAAITASQGILAIASNDNIGTSDPRSYCLTDAEVTAAAFTAPDVAQRLQFTSFLSNGFRFNKLEGTATHLNGYLALKGGTYALGNFLTATNTTAFTEAHGMAAAPKGAMFFSANRAASTQDVSTATAEFSIGASDGTNNVCQYVREKVVAGADCFTAVSHDQCYLNADNSATMILEGEGHVNSFDATNINFQMFDADPVQSFIWYVAFGNVAGGGNTDLTPGSMIKGT